MAGNRDKKDARNLRVKFEDDDHKVPNFVQMVIKEGEDGLPVIADDNQFKQIEKLFNAWYNVKEPAFEVPGKKTSKEDSSYLGTDYVDEEDIMKELSENIMKAKFSLLIKSLNIILVQKSDPFVAKMYRNYIRVKRKKGLEQQRQKNFYQRMQMDIKKRTVEETKTSTAMINKLTSDVTSASIDTSRSGSRKIHMRNHSIDSNGSNNANKTTGEYILHEVTEEDNYMESALSNNSTFKRKAVKNRHESSNSNWGGMKIVITPFKEDTVELGGTPAIHKDNRISTTFGKNNLKRLSKINVL